MHQRGQSENENKLRGPEGPILPARGARGASRAKSAASI
jgi:hypothetical protein